MIKTTEDYIELFKADMNGIITTWKQYENDFYNTLRRSNQDDDFYSPLFAGGKDSFPKLLYNEWVLNNPQVDFQKANLDKIIRNGKLTIDNMQAGENFENFLARMAVSEKDNSGNWKKALANAFPQVLEHTGHLHMREDFRMTDIFTIDAKYSTLSSDDRFKNIIKPWGSPIIRSIIDIEESILNSLYSQGASHHRWLPQNTGVKNVGIYDYEGKDGERVWKEISDTMYRDLAKKRNINIPSHRKILIYMFNDNGYWTSECLEEITNWAEKRLKQLKFLNAKKSYTQKEFWDFKDWHNREIFYGKRTNN